MNESLAVREKLAIRQALEQAIMHSSEPMVLSDPHLPDMPVVVANRAFEDLTGYGSAEIIGRNCRFLQGPRTDRQTAARIGRCIADGHGCIEWIVNTRRNGTAFWNLLFISPVRDADGRILYFFGNQLDMAAGLPAGMDEVPFGRANMSPATEAAFHAQLRDIIAATAGAEPDRSRALERILAAARAVSELSTRLDAGGQPG